MKFDIPFNVLDSELGEYPPFLISLSDGPDEELRLVIAASEICSSGDSSDCFSSDENHISAELGRLFEKSCSAVPKNSCMYMICFHDYIIYQIRNESFCSSDPCEVRQGRYLILFEESGLLSLLPVITDAQQLSDGTYYPGKWKHYGVYTQRHIIDIVSHKAPQITRYDS